MCLIASGCRKKVGKLFELIWGATAIGWMSLPAPSAWYSLANGPMLKQLGDRSHLAPHLRNRIGS